MADTKLVSSARGHRRRTLLILAGSILLFGLSGQPQAIAAPTAVSEPATNRKTVTIPVEGMSCVACAAAVKKALKSIDGVSNVEVSLENRTARVTYASDTLSPDSFVTIINKLGYKAGVPAVTQ